MNAKTSTAVAENDNQAAAGMPLFFQAPALVDKEAHAEAGVKKDPNYSFAAKTNSLPVNVTEFIEASKSYPIVFTNDDKNTPVVVTGLEEDKNYFVDSKGQWLEREYVPAYARQYPFILFTQENDENVYLCVDTKAEAFEEKASKSALPLFKDGEPALVTQNALTFCTAYFNERKFTEEFCKDLKELGLFMEGNSKAKLQNGKELGLSGFSLIDEKKFNALSKADFEKLRAKNYLGFIYLALASASNWQALANLASKQSAN